MQKFLFEHSFEPEALARELQLQMAPSFTQEQLDKEKTASHEKGHQEGYNKAYGEIEEKISKALGQIHEKTSALFLVENAVRDQVYEDTILLVSHILNKIAPSLLMISHENEIISFITQVVAGLKNKPELKILVHPSLLENLKVKLNDLLVNHPITLDPDADLEIYDCRIAWDNGGKERLCRPFIEEIDRNLEAFLISLKETYSQIQGEHKTIDKQQILETQE